jgi:hypothetical protein
MTLQLLHSEFPYIYVRKILFLFYQCGLTWPVLLAS